MSDCRFGVSPVNYPDPDPTVSHSEIIANQKCKRFTFHIDMQKVIRHTKLLPHYAMHVLIKLWTTQPDIIVFRQHFFLLVKSTEDDTCMFFAMYDFQLRNFSRHHERQRKNHLGNSHYFIDKSRCSEKLKAS